MARVDRVVARVIMGLVVGGAAGHPLLAAEPQSESLSQALRNYGEQQRQTIIFTEDVVAGLPGHPVDSHGGAAADLQQLLAGTNLVADRSPSGAWMIRRETAGRPAVRASDDRARPIRVAQQGAAQPAPAPAPAPAAVEVDEVVVTGSRIARDGFLAPTPTTVLSLDELQSRGANNIIESLNEIPAFRPTQTPAAAARGGSTNGGSFLDLRGLNNNGGGPNSTATARTLVLVDGRRFVSSNARGQVDVSLIPTSLVERTEVVTGGASAAWGSDAIAGVVNLILKNKLQGVEANVSYGQSAQSDNREKSINLAGGTSFASGRGHIIAGAEYVDNDGAPDAFVSRDWGRDGWGVITLPANRAAGLTSRVLSKDVRISDQATAGGIVFGGPLDNLQFLSGGGTSVFVPGSLVGGNQMAGGGVNNAGVYFTGGSNLINPLSRYAALAHASFDLTDATSAFLEVSRGGSKFDGLSASKRDLSPATLTIQRTNPFLPASVVQQMTALGLQTLSVGRIAFDDNYGFYTRHAEQHTERIVAGLEGTLPKDWKWNFYAEWGQNHIDQADQATLVSNYLSAVNATAGPNGTIVCGTISAAQTALTGAPDPGCQPFNIFGRNSPSQAAVDYVRSYGINDQKTRQTAAAININGEPFAIWAGPVSLAGGLEYRKETAENHVDVNSLNSRFDLGNYKPLDGSYDTREVYLETVVPLLKNLPAANSLELNAAARRTDYSISGAVTTWKVGLAYEPVSDVKLRATRSRDIRAPNLSELFSQSSFTRAPVTNPFTGGGGQQVDVYTNGSTDLVPEVAKTTTAGVLYQPSWAPQLRASVDYYNIEINDLIGQFATQLTIDRCFAGVTALCGNLVFGANNSLVRVNNRTLNFNSLVTSGVDIEMSYAFPMERIGLPGQLSLRTFATFVNEMTTTDPTGPINRIKETVPKWTGNVSLTYALDRFSTTAQVRYIRNTLFDATLIGPDSSAFSPTLANSININERPTIMYVNLSAQYRLSDSDRGRLQLYGVANNVFDKDPPAYAGLNATTASLYDLVGRAYKLGIRYSF